MSYKYPRPGETGYRIFIPLPDPIPEPPPRPDPTGLTPKSTEKKRPTHCSQGHRYDRTNTIETAHGYRVCRQCKRQRQRGQSQANDLATIRPLMTPTKLRAFRAEHGLTVSGLARALGVYRRSYQRWESGLNQPPPYLQLALERLTELLKDEA